MRGVLRMAVDPSIDTGKVQCRSCGSESLVFLGNCLPFSGKDADKKPSTDTENMLHSGLYRCSFCHLGQRVPCANESQLKQMYECMPEGLMVYEFDTNAAWSKAYELMLGRYSESDSPTVLDIGCNEGLFLSKLPGNWQRFGVEANAKAGRVAQSQGVDVIGKC